MQVHGIDSETSVSSYEEVGPDHFPLACDCSLREEHLKIGCVLQERAERADVMTFVDCKQLAAGKELLASVETRRLFHALLARFDHTGQIAADQWKVQQTSLDRPPPGGTERYIATFNQIIGQLLRHIAAKVILDSTDVDACLTAIARHCNRSGVGGHLPEKQILKSLERYVKTHSFTEQQIERLRIWRAHYLARIQYAAQEHRRRAERLTKLIGDAPPIPIEPGEAWADAALEHLAGMADEEKEQWIALLTHCCSASGSKPSLKWQRRAAELIEMIGHKRFVSIICRWLSLIAQPRTQPMPNVPHPDWYAYRFIDGHIELLKGLIWSLIPYATNEVVRTLGTTAVSAYKKVSGVGARCIRIGNSCVASLAAIEGADGVAQLAILKSRVKGRAAQKEIEKAMCAAAARLGISREEIEEMVVPTYGLNGVGSARTQVGEFVAELSITGTTSTQLQWINAKGRMQKSIPAAVKTEHAEDVKQLKATAKDMQRMLPAQRDRLDRMMLHRKSWPLGLWRERYLDHSLVGTLARRLIWMFADGDSRTAAIFDGAAFIDVRGKTIAPRETASVELWHPIGANVDEVRAWRELLSERQIVQPFKQAHREVYLLTDAERNTRTYSNRFAAHILRQHQFNALTAARGWKNQLRLMVDADYAPPTLFLPEHSLRAEFWVDGIGDDYGSDTTDAGTYLYLATDQVRFYRLQSPQRSAHAFGGGYRVYGDPDNDLPVPLEEIPALIFSEVMRDVDLFVGVASVANDPTWFDGRSEADTTNWNRYSFGELSAIAKTRRDVLERIIPRLAIADRCSFTEKFLVVRGDVRTYKIHIGSGNILMEPNDQYLCIVADRGLGSRSENVYLPFEGDQTLSIILSKAMMLAADRSIKDSTILQQITLR